MKTVVLAVLLFLAVASIVSGAPGKSNILLGDTTESGIVSGDATESGKSRNGDETYLPVTLQTLQLYKILSLLNYELRHDEWRSRSKTPGVLVPTPEAKVQVAQ
jgi:hypothetical protein